MAASHCQLPKWKDSEVHAASKSRPQSPRVTRSLSQHQSLCLPVMQKPAAP